MRLPRTSAKLTAQVPTGYQSKELIKKAGLNLGDVDQFPDINVTLDGADDVDGDLNAIKGARNSTSSTDHQAVEHVICARRCSPRRPTSGSLSPTRARKASSSVRNSQA